MPCAASPALPLLRRLQSQALAYMVVSQTGNFKTGFKRRTLTAV